MNYKDIDFTIENAEKFPEAILIRRNNTTTEWHITKDNSKVFYINGISWEFPFVSLLQSITNSASL